MLLAQGASREAAAHFTHSGELARTAGATDKVAAALRGLGDVARLTEATARARVHYENALEACAATWFSVGETARILIGLARLSLAEGDPGRRPGLARPGSRAGSGPARPAPARRRRGRPGGPRPGTGAGGRTPRRRRRPCAARPCPGAPDVARTTRHTRACLSAQGLRHGLRAWPEPAVGGGRRAVGRR
ncbi:hypothetical protein LT493_19205 [Streptomyces tricolor]|nr:hypothetical protein [Streptomyces tricolor]